MIAAPRGNPGGTDAVDQFAREALDPRPLQRAFEAHPADQQERALSDARRSGRRQTKRRRQPLAVAGARVREPCPVNPDSGQRGLHRSPGARNIMLDNIETFIKHKR